jgi:ankyrin repeat protein
MLFNQSRNLNSFLQKETVDINEFKKFLDKKYSTLSTKEFKCLLMEVNKSGFSPLNAASKGGQLEVVKSLLYRASQCFSQNKKDFKAFLTQVNIHDFSPLNTAAHAGHVVIMHELLASAQQVFAGDTAGFQAFLTHANKDGFTPLNAAAKAGHVEIVHELIAWAQQIFAGDTAGFKAFLTHANKDGFTPLNAAAKAGHLGIMQALLASAQQIFAGDTTGFQSFLSQTDNYGFSPFNAAVKSGHVEIMYELLANAQQTFGDDVAGFQSFLTHANKDGFTPLNAAAAAGNVEVVHTLLASAQQSFSDDVAGFQSFLTHTDKYGFSPLNAAAKIGNVEIVHELLASAQQVFVDDTSGFQRFLTHANKDGFTPLNAAAAGNVEVVQALLASAQRSFGDDVAGFQKFLTQANKEGFSPLNTASGAGNVEVMHVLLASAQQVFAGDTAGFQRFLTHANKDGFSPLNAAVKAGNLELVQALLASAQQVFAGDTAGFQRFLTYANRDGFSPLNGAAAMGNVEIVQALLTSAQQSFGDDLAGFQSFLTHTDRYSFSPLNAAAKTGNIEIVHKLLVWAQQSFGNDVAGFQRFLTHANKDGFNPLNAAAKIGNIEIVHELLVWAQQSFGNDVAGFQRFLTHANKDGFSPLNAAAAAGNVEIVQALLINAQQSFKDDKFGFQAFLTHTDSYDFSPLNAAAKIGNIEIVHELLVLAQQSFGNDVAGFQRFLTHANKDGFSPLNAAAAAGNVEVVQALLASAQQSFGDDVAGYQSFLTQRDRYGFTPLNTAVKAGHVEIVRELLASLQQSFGDELAFLTQTNKDGFTPLNSALKQGHTEVIFSLLKKGRELFAHKPLEWQNFLSAPNNDGFTPLHSICAIGTIDVLKHFLSEVQAAYANNPEAYQRFLEQKNRYHEEAFETGDFYWKRKDRALADTLYKLIKAAKKQGPDSLAAPMVLNNSYSHAQQSNTKTLIEEEFSQPTLITEAVRSLPLEVDENSTLGLVNNAFQTTQSPLHGTLAEPVIPPVEKKPSSGIHLTPLDSFEQHSSLPIEEEHFIFAIATTGTQDYQSLEQLVDMISATHTGSVTLILGLNREKSAANQQALKALAEAFKHKSLPKNVNLVFDSFTWEVDNPNAAVKVNVPFGSIRNKLMSRIDDYISHYKIQKPIACFLDADVTINPKTLDTLQKTKYQAGSLGSIYKKEQPTSSRLDVLLEAASDMDLKTKKAIGRYAYFIEHCFFLKGDALQAILKVFRDQPKLKEYFQFPFNLKAAESRGVIQFLRHLGMDYGFPEAGSGTPINLGYPKHRQLKKIETWADLKKMLFSLPYSSANRENFAKQCAIEAAVSPKAHIINKCAYMMDLPRLIEQGLTSKEQANQWVDELCDYLMKKPTEQSFLGNFGINYFDSAVANELDVFKQQELTSLGRQKEEIIGVCKAWAKAGIKSFFESPPIMHCFDSFKRDFKQNKDYQHQLINNINNQAGKSDFYFEDSFYSYQPRPLTKKEKNVMQQKKESQLKKIELLMNKEKSVSELNIRPITTLDKLASEDDIGVQETNLKKEADSIVNLEHLANHTRQAHLRRTDRTKMEHTDLFLFKAPKGKYEGYSQQLKQELRKQIGEQANAVIFQGEYYYLWKNNEFIREDNRPKRHPIKPEFNSLLHHSLQSESTLLQKLSGEPYVIKWVKKQLIEDYSLCNTAPVKSSTYHKKSAPSSQGFFAPSAQNNTALVHKQQRTESGTHLNLYTHPGT